MKAPVSRRAFLFGLGGVASAGLGFALWKSPVFSRASIDPYPLPEAYVDYGGWMVTKADKDKLMANAGIKRLDASMFDGHDIADRIVQNVDDCASWCLNEPDCQGFSYAKPSHPDARLQNRCWLKGTSQLTPVTDVRFTSGVR